MTDSWLPLSNKNRILQNITLKAELQIELAGPITEGKTVKGHLEYSIQKHF